MTSTIDQLRAQAYQLALRGMFTLSPERIHEIINTALSGLQAAGPANRALAKILPVNDPVPVSYTHLTLPTSDLV